MDRGLRRGGEGGRGGTAQLTCGHPGGSRRTLGDRAETIRNDARRYVFLDRFLGRVRRPRVDSPV